MIEVVERLECMGDMVNSQSIPPISSKKKRLASYGVLQPDNASLNSGYAKGLGDKSE